VIAHLLQTLLLLLEVLLCLWLLLLHLMLATA
jgi:hypothetical protein